MRRFAYVLTLIGSAAVLASAASVAPALDKTAEEAARSKTLAASHVEVGDQLTAGKHFDYARSEYAAAAQLVRKAGELPVLAIRRIANTYYFEGEYGSAARVLDDLAAEASVRGATLTQVWALADGAWLAGLMEDEAGFAERMKKLGRLLESGDLSAEDRSAVEAKLDSAGFMAFAPHLSSW